MRLTLSKRLLCGASCLALAPALLAGAAHAQEAVRPAGEVAEVVVTAQKREQRLIDVPVAINTLTGETIDQRGIDDVQDLSYSVPGLILRYDGPGSSQVFMRGAANIRGSDALVSTYMDEVPVTLTGGFRQLDLRMLDIDRVEVLKGPQGTLYGQGAMAGTIRFITKNPSLTTFEGFVKGDYSVIKHGDDNAKLSGAVNIPLVEDKLAIRLAGGVEDGGGWIDQPGRDIKDGNNQDIVNFRAKLYFKPTEAFDLMATVGVYSMKSEFGLDYENPDRTRPVPLRPDYDLLPPRHDRSRIYNLTGNYDIGFATLTSSTSYIKLDRDYVTTYIAGPLTTYAVQNEGFDGIQDRAKQFTQELRLTSSGDGPLQYTFGGYYRDAHSNLYDVGISYFAGATYPFVYQAVGNSRSVSGFADVSYEFFDRLTVGAGVRVFSDKVRSWTGGPTQQETFKSTDPRFYFTYAVGPRLNIYGNVSRGFRSGGFNAAGLPPYEPEKLTSYELGTKGVVAGGRLQFDVAVFFSKYDDALRTGQFFNFEAGGGFVSLTRNIGELEVKGIEGSFEWYATDDLKLSATAAYTDTEVTSLDIGAGESTNVEVGDRGDYAPKVTFSVAADYDFIWMTGREGFFHVDYSYRDKTYATDSSILSPRQQASQTVGLLNARLGARRDRLTAEVYVNNITNENRQVDPYQAWQQSSRTKPRTIGVVLSQTF